MVMQARVSEDYFAGKDQWKVGVSSIFARALRIQPYKDTFWTTSVQPGNPYSNLYYFPISIAYFTPTFNGKLRIFTFIFTDRVGMKTKWPRPVFDRTLEKLSVFFFFFFFSFFLFFFFFFFFFFS